MSPARVNPFARSTANVSAQVAARRRCLIVGAGGHGRVVLDILAQMGTQETVGFLDSNAALQGRRVDGVPVHGSMRELAEVRDRLGVECAVVAIGDNGVRRAFADQLEHAGIELVNAIHPSANVARNASLGRNIVIAAGALVCAHCQIGDSVILNTGCIVDHESLIGTATHVCPGARLAGRVTVESGAFVGIGATVIQSIRVGYEAVVGAGAVVIRDVAPMSTVVGVPAREVKLHAAADDARAWMAPEFLRNARAIASLTVPG
jgi:sugar O-acyltransferase (sialic acid O-acetyltransferase NeuD family)